MTHFKDNKIVIEIPNFDEANGRDMLCSMRNSIMDLLAFAAQDMLSQPDRYHVITLLKAMFEESV